MLNLLPEVYHQNDIIINLQNAIYLEYNKLFLEITGLGEQSFIDQATWSLNFWEKMFGIQSDISTNINDRRSMIKSKLSANGTTTTQMIKKICKDYVSQDVDIIENFGQCVIIIKFTGFIGVPPNSDSLKAALLELIPCHLALEFKFVFNTWKDIEDINLTWTEAMSLGLTWEDLETFTR